MAENKGSWGLLLCSSYVFFVFCLQNASSQSRQGSFYLYAFEDSAHHVLKRGAENISYAPATLSTTVLPNTRSSTQRSDILRPRLNSSTPPTLDVAGKVGTNLTASMENSTEGYLNGLPVYPSNKTLSEHNINKTEEDHHKYYNSTLTVDENIGHTYWVDMTNRSDVTVNEMLSKSHRRAATVRLSFDFPFYGHLVRNVTVATGGFLYTGDYVHSWLAATQYIAPLMANFDTSLSNNSFIKYVDNGTAFTVQWERVVLQDKPEYGDFTFQATLHSNGDIVFVYQHVPVTIEAIQDVNHPVKVGLSDAYIVDRTIFFVRRKTIYEYHRILLSKEGIQNWTVICLYALPTCVELKDCHSCLSQASGFECQWCPTAKRCSDGMDRYRQEWMHSECHKQNYTDIAKCQPTTVPSVLPATQAASSFVPKEEPADSNSGVGTILVFLVTGMVIIMFVLWIIYAYRNPHTASGQILIRYRPSQWRWRRGEARYTAATIHM